MGTLRELEKSIHADIPLSLHLKVSVARRERDRIVLAAPFEPNSNHNGTVFGGSLYSVAVLAGWALVSEALEGLNVEYVVIQDAEMKYLEPVSGEFIADACWPSEAEREKFLTTVKRRGLGRASVEVEIRSAEKKCGTLQARFAASQKRQENFSELRKSTAE